MKSTNLQVVSTPPSLIKSLMAGFDAISNHVGLILFSICMDLLLWFGPHFRLANLFKPFLNQPVTLPEMQSLQMTGVLQTTLDEFNLLGVIRTFPIGIPSLMVSHIVKETPLGIPRIWEVPSFGSAVFLWLVFSIIGLAAGTLYFIVVSQAALFNRVSWRQALSQWPWALSQILLLTIVWIALLVALFIPFSCFLTLLMITGLGLDQVALIVILIFVGLLVWFLIPLVFSPHGIFVNRNFMWTSIRQSIRLTRFTLPTTSLLLVVILVLSQGLDVLWGMPPEKSWFTLVGIVGHAFVTTSLLAASFIYYRDADRWLQRLIQQAKLSMA